MAQVSRAANSFSRPWLAVSRAVWVCVAALAIGLFLAGLPYRYADLLRPCTAASSVCSNFMRPTAAEQAELITRGISPQTYAAGVTAFFTAYGLCSWAIALTIFMRRSVERGAWTISLTVLLFATNSAMWQSLADRFPALQAVVHVLVTGSMATFGLLFATFPNGRVVPRPMWVVVALWALYSLLDNQPGQGTINDTLANVAWLTLFLSGIASQIYRYLRVSSPLERRQTKWVVMGLASLTLTVLFLTTLLQADPAYFHGVNPKRIAFQAITIAAAFFSIPVPLAIAILRHGLWDIDVVIRRTLVYSVVSALLALIYFGSVLVLQTLFTTFTGQGSPVAVVVSTLVIAALFLPLRARVQDLVDRRFYRRKYDSAKALADFSAAARDETDLAVLSTRLTEVLEETMQPQRISVWFDRRADVEIEEQHR